MFSLCPPPPIPIVASISGVRYCLFSLFLLLFLSVKIMFLSLIYSVGLFKLWMLVKFVMVMRRRIDGVDGDDILCSICSVKK